MKIRFATIQDQDSVLGLLDQLLQEIQRESGGIVPAKTTGQAERQRIYQELLNKKDVRIFLAEEGSVILGMADIFILPIMRRGYSQAHVEDLVVSEEARGKGVGTALMDAIKKYCRENDIKVIKLTSGTELIRAHNFYEKNGGKTSEKMFRFDL